MNMHAAPPIMPMPPVRDIMGVDVAVLDETSAVALFSRLIAERRFTKVAFLNAYVSNVAKQDSEFCRTLGRFTVLADGVGVDIASKVLYGEPFPSNLNGTDFVPSLLRKLPGGSATAAEHEANVDATTKALKATLKDTFEQVKLSLESLENKTDEALTQTLDQIAAALEEIPARIEKMIRDIIKKIDTALQETLDDVFKMVNETTARTAKLLDDTLILVIGTIDGIINDGFALIHDVKDKLYKLLDELVEEIRDLTLGTLGEVKKGANGILDTFEGGCKEILDAMETAVKESVDEIGGKMNAQIKALESDLSTKANKIVRDLTGQTHFKQRWAPLFRRIAGRISAARAWPEYVAACGDAC